MLPPWLTRTRPSLTHRLINDPRRSQLCQWRDSLDHNIIYPSLPNLFAALIQTPLDHVKIVILWQDPYHQPWQAHWLAFSVPPNSKHPPSLRSIYQEVLACYWRDTTQRKSLSPCLSGRASQGVLLLNTSLSVMHGKPGSHSHHRRRVTQTILATINESCTGIVFLLWGDHASKAGKIIDTTSHHVLTTSHPSPLSAHRWFLGSKHFLIANDLLIQQGKSLIDRLWPLESDETLFSKPS